MKVPTKPSQPSYHGVRSAFGYKLPKIIILVHQEKSRWLARLEYVRIIPLYPSQIATRYPSKPHLYASGAGGPKQPQTQWFQRLRLRNRHVNRAFGMFLLWRREGEHNSRTCGLCSRIVGSWLMLQCLLDTSVHPIMTIVS